MLVRLILFFVIFANELKELFVPENKIELYFKEFKLLYDGEFIKLVYKFRNTHKTKSPNQSVMCTKNST